MRTCVVGCGALGGLIGGRLALAGADLTVVDRGERLQALAAGGLHLAHPNGEESHVTSLSAASVETAQGPFDLLILATKANDIAAVAPSVAGLMHPDSVVVTVQNGIPWWYFERHGGEREGRRLQSLDPEGRISACLPADRVLGAVAYPACTVPSPGKVLHVEGERIPIGELDGSTSARVECVAGMLEVAGFRSRILKDVRSEIWLKAIGSLAFNPLSALTGATLAGMCGFLPTRELALRMMHEAEAVCGELGVTLRRTPERRIEGAEAVGEHRTSMLQDLEAGRELEIEAVLGSVVELARMEEIPTPNLDAVYAATLLLASQRPASR
ncbi:MAG: 2-dehydropantoate 2-reductase [Gemmatimonadota bacterium]